MKTASREYPVCVRRFFRERVEDPGYTRADRRHFSEHTGMTPLEYRDHLRFTEAKFLLSCGMTVTKAAEQVGFCDASYLRRIYKKRTGHALSEDSLPKIV